MKKIAKSPLKHSKKLRYAGQSLDDKIDGIQFDIDKYFVVISYLLGMVVMGWITYFTNISIPFLIFIAMTVIVIACIFFYIYKFIGFKKNLKKLRLGRDGEKEVAAILDTLRKEGVHIFHDVINEDKTFNLDHIIISTKGVFIIETKTRSKQVTDAIIHCDANSFTIKNGKDYSGNKILMQAKSQATWLKKIIGNDNIFSIVVFPGWFVKGHLSNKRKIEIRNPTNLKQFIESKPDLLTVEQSNAISGILYTHVRMSSY